MRSSPASPVRVASLEGFSNKQSKPALRQRRQGGLSAPSQRIFCFRHALHARGTLLSVFTIGLTSGFEDSLEGSLEPSSTFLTGEMLESMTRTKLDSPLGVDWTGLATASGAMAVRKEVAKRNGGLHTDLIQTPVNTNFVLFLDLPVDLPSVVMLVMLASHLLCSWFVFLQPCYSTFKTLSRTPPYADLQVWCMYWAVVGAFIAIENILGFLMSWLPFYWELRTLFLLYLSLPQIQGSTYVYKTYLEPFCRINEAEFDAGIASVTSSILEFFQSCVTSVTDIFFNLLNKTPITTQPQSDRAVYDTSALN